MDLLIPVKATKSWLVWVAVVSSMWNGMRDRGVMRRRCRLETRVVAGACACRGARLAGAGLIATLAWALPVADAEAQTIGLSLSETSVSEDAGAADVTVTATLSSSQTGSTTVTLSLAGTATSEDYTVAGSLPSIVIPSGQTTASATFVVSLVDDTYWEGEEAIEVNGSASDLIVTGASLVLTDNDRVSGILLAYGGLSNDWLDEETEGIQTARIQATLVGPSTFSQDTAVTFSFGGTATFGVDYQLTVSSVVIPAGATEASVDLPFHLIDDEVYEGGLEQIHISGTAIGPDGTSVTITHSDGSFVRIYINEEEGIPYIELYADLPEIAEDDGPVVITVRARRFGATSSGSSTVIQLVVEGPATPGVDFQLPATLPTITIPALSTSASVTMTLTPIVDDLDEGREYISFGGTASGGETVRGGDRLYLLDGGNVPARVIRMSSSNTRKVFLEGDDIGHQLTFNRRVAMSGTPTLDYVIGDRVRRAPCELNPRGHFLWCNYTVVAGDRDFDGIVIPATFNVTGVTMYPWGTTDFSPGNALAVESSLPAYAVGLRRELVVHGGMSYSFFLSVDREGVQEGAGATAVTVTATLQSQAAPQTELVLPLAVSNVTTTDADYTVGGTLEIRVPVGQLVGHTVLTLTPIEDGVKETRIETLRVAGGSTPSVHGQGEIAPSCPARAGSDPMVAPGSASPCGLPPPPRAGSDPGGHHQEAARERLPRARGERPNACSACSRVYSAAPRARGATLQHQHRIKFATGCPARAGSDLLADVRAQPCNGLPRARGERPRTRPRENAEGQRRSAHSGMEAKPERPPTAQGDPESGSTGRSRSIPPSISERHRPCHRPRVDGNGPTDKNPLGSG